MGHPGNTGRATAGRLRVIPALLLVAGTLFAGTAESVTRVTLGSTLRLSGSGAAFVNVRLARPMRPPPASSIRATGDPGRVAIMLVKENDLRSAPPYLLADRLPTSVGEPWGITMGGDGTSEPVLPAGNYRAYLVAARPTTVTLRLPGQSGGTTSLTTRVRVRHRSTELPVSRVAGQYRPVSEVNETFTFRRPGLVLGLAVLDHSTMWDYSIGGCFYEGRPPPGEDVAQVCAGGTSFGTGGGYLVPSVTPNRVVGGLISLPIQPRTVSFGVYYRFVGTLTRVRQFNLWLEYVP